MGLNIDRLVRSSAARANPLPQPASTVTLAVVDNRTAPTSVPPWGWLPALSALGALGLVLVALADTGARGAAEWAEPLFWTGLLVVFVPVAIRLATAETTPREGIGLITILGLELYLVKVLQSPLGFILHDEFFHWRTLNDILSTGHLFAPNPLLPVSALYPGLETITAALVGVSGLSFFNAGLVVIGIARLMLMLALYLFFRELRGSTRIAGVACLIYMANPNFVFFDAVFSYESLALSFVMVALFAVIRRQHVAPAGRWGMNVTLLLTLAALIMTHHIAAYAFIGFLVLWMVADHYAEFYKGRGQRDTFGPSFFGPLALVLTMMWLLFMANATIGYLAPTLWGAVTALGGLIQHEESGRQLFTSSTGYVAPLWERTIAFTAVGLILFAIPFGLLEIWRRRTWTSSMTMALAVGALLYPVSLVFRLTGAGWEASNRSSEYLFLPLGFVLALGICKFWLMGRAVWWRVLPFAAGATILFMGGIIAGWPPAWRLPGPYVILPDTAGGMRDIGLKGLAATDWVRMWLGPYNRIGADPTNSLLLGSLGEQNIQTTLSGGINPEWVLYALRITDDQEALLARGKVRYLLVDHRLITVPQLAQPYYPLKQIDGPLAKFDYLKDVNRIFDDGDIAIYDVGAISHAP